MKCKNARILISAAADGELSQRESLALGEHLASCAECRREQRAVSGVRRALTAWKPSEPAESLTDAFMMRLSRERDARASGWRSLIFARLPAYGLASAVAVVILAVVYIATMKPAGQSPSVASNHPAMGGPRPAVVATAPGAPRVAVLPIPAGSETERERRHRVAYAPHTVRQRHVDRYSSGRPEATEHYAVVAIAPETADAAKAVSDSAKREAERRVAEKVAKLRTLIAEANTRIEEAIIRPDSQPSDVTTDYDSEPDGSPS